MVNELRVGDLVRFPDEYDGLNLGNYVGIVLNPNVTNAEYGNMALVSWEHLDKGHSFGTWDRGLVQPFTGDRTFWNVPKKGLRLLQKNSNSGNKYSKVELKILEIRIKRQALGYQW